MTGNTTMMIFSHNTFFHKKIKKNLKKLKKLNFENRFELTWRWSISFLSFPTKHVNLFNRSVTASIFAAWACNFVAVVGAGLTIESWLFTGLEPAEDEVSSLSELSDEEILLFLKLLEGVVITSRTLGHALFLPVLLGFLLFVGFVWFLWETQVGINIWILFKFLKKRRKYLRGSNVYKRVSGGGGKRPKNLKNRKNPQNFQTLAIFLDFQWGASFYAPIGPVSQNV